MNNTIGQTIEFEDPETVFNYAIAKGDLTTIDIGSDLDRYAGNWMYMHSDALNHYFKNIATRKYIEISRIA